MRNTAFGKARKNRKKRTSKEGKETITFMKGAYGETILYFSISKLKKTFKNEDLAKDFIREHRGNTEIFKNQSPSIRRKVNPKK